MMRRKGQSGSSRLNGVFGGFFVCELPVAQDPLTAGIERDDGVHDYLVNFAGPLAQPNP